MLETLDERTRRTLEDALVRRAARAGWRPAAPSQQLINEVQSFVAAARRVGHAEPGEYDDYLRASIKAAMAGDHETAKATLETLLDPLTDGDIDLGQDEMVDEVLSVSLHDCAARYAAAVYLTAPLPDRADALFSALTGAGRVTYWGEPLGALEQALGGALPDGDRFLPAWIARLEREQPRAGEESERWLREAVARSEGLAGLARLARSSRRGEALQAWCDATVVAGDWAVALAAYEEAAATVTAADKFWRGDFLDGAALAARELGRKDATRKLEAAWLTGLRRSPRRR
ncbi:MAG TPA: hypothetical protein VGQ83_09400 [Polyangia bacterium]|jgi:hypothetical protein